VAIQSFTDKATQGFYETGKLKKATGWQSVAKVVLRKLDMLHYAAELSDLKSPPNNRLEELKGDLKGLHSIRVNDQWRVVFKWTAQGPKNVRIMDYHK
jgi:proteic killer suppression protein